MNDEVKPTEIKVSTPSGEISLSSDLTPTERLWKINEAYGGAGAPQKQGIPPSVHWDPIAKQMVSMVPEVEKPASPPPKPAGAAERRDLAGWFAHLGRENPDAPKEPDVRVPPGLDVDPKTVEALNRNYRAQYTAATTDAERDRLRTIYNRDMQEVMDSRKQGESREQYKARKTVDEPAFNSALEKALASADSAGWVPVASMRELTSGYELPPEYTEVQGVKKIVGALRMARKEGWTQDEVTGALRKLWGTTE